MIWICKLAKSAGQTRLTIPKGLVKVKPFLKVGYVQLDDKTDNQIIIKEVVVNGEKTVNGKINSNGEDR